MDRDKYRRLFIDEAREGLALIGNELVAVEKAGGDDPDEKADRKARFDSVFRSAHSLKGMAAAMGYARTANLAHRLEDLADLGRQGMALPADAYDLLLQGTDVLSSCVDRVEAGDEDTAGDDSTAELAVRLSVFFDKLKVSSGRDTAVAQAPPVPSPPSPPAPPPAAPPPAPIDVDGDVTVVRVEIAPDASAPQVRAFVVVKALSALPGFIDCAPTGDALRQKDHPEFQKNRIVLFRFYATGAIAEALEKAKVAQGVKDATVVVVDKKQLQPKEDAAPHKAPDPGADRTVRVRTALLDDLIDSVGEVLLTRARLRALSLRLSHPELEDLVDEVDRLTRELHGRVVAARMTPLSLLTERLPRIVRDLARQQNKSVDFVMHGMDIELDRAILDELQAPLVHMVRNAVDHGHEGDAARQTRGALPMMKLVLSATRDRDRVLLTLSDDGKGMSPAALRERAVAKGLIDKARADQLNDEGALELICLPGFSTAQQLTETSGRGVGMDVVKSTLEKLGGALRIHAAPQRGSTITLQLPLTVAIIQVLELDTGADSAFVLPVGRVEAALAVDDDVVSSASGRTFIKVNDDLVPLIDLPALLGLAPLSVPGTAILVRGPHGNVALRVRRIQAQEEVVAKPLGEPLSTVPFVAGAAILADGRAAFILEPQRLPVPT